MLTSSWPFPSWKCVEPAWELSPAHWRSSGFWWWILKPVSQQEKIQQAPMMFPYYHIFYSFDQILSVHSHNRAAPAVSFPPPSVCFTFLSVSVIYHTFISFFCLVCRKPDIYTAWSMYVQCMIVNMVCREGLWYDKAFLVVYSVPD